MADNSMRTWALKGAEQRLLEISEEAAAIYASFPELRDGGNANLGGARRGRPSRGDESGNGRAPARRKRTMSAEARKRISEAQKARWARQKGQSAAALEEPGDTTSAQKSTRKSNRKKK